MLFHAGFRNVGTLNQTTDVVTLGAGLTLPTTCPCPRGHAWHVPPVIKRARGVLNAIVNRRPDESDETVRHGRLVYIALGFRGG